jgi:hypothetical protein
MSQNCDEFYKKYNQATPVAGATSTPITTYGGTSPTAMPAATSAGTRQNLPTGVGNSAPFYQGETVWGFRIILANGVTCTGGDCYLINAPMDGTLVDGMINPNSVPAHVTTWDGTTNKGN